MSERSDGEEEEGESEGEGEEMETEDNHSITNSTSTDRKSIARGSSSEWSHRHVYKCSIIFFLISDEDIDSDSTTS